MGWLNTSFEEILDRCLALMHDDQLTVEGCLAQHPRYKRALRPLLELALAITAVSSPVPRPAAVAKSRARMMNALAEKHRRQATTSKKPIPSNRKDPLPPAVRSPSASWAGLVILATVAAVLGLTFLAFQPGERVVQTATLSKTSSTVEIRPAGSTDWEPVGTGTEVHVGDRVRTGADGRATLVLLDGSTTTLQGSTEVAITDLAACQRGGSNVTRLHLVIGQTRHRVEPLVGTESKFQVRTPLAVVTVRGTEFSIAVEASGTTHVTVRTGEVEVATDQETATLLAEERITVANGLSTLGPPAETTPSVTLQQPTSTSPPELSPAPVTAGTPAAPGSPTEETGGVEDEHSPPTTPGGTPETGPETTHQPPGLTKTPQPPGLTKTPEPPGQDRKPGEPADPQPPGQDKEPGEPADPQPPGQDKKPGEPADPQPPGQDKKPGEDEGEP